MPKILNRVGITLSERIMCQFNNAYHATPYDINAHGFYFSSLEEYQEKSGKHTNIYGQPVEEYEIQFIEGDYPDLFRALGISQSTLNLWFKHFESMREREVSRCLYLARNLGMGIEEISQYDLDHIQLFSGSAKEYADSYLEESGLLEQVPECLRDFIDASAYAQDMLLRGALFEFSVDNKMYVVLQHS